MSFAAAGIYWVVVALWAAVLSSVIIFYARNPKAFGTIRLLLLVVGIDAFRNIFENVYFGIYFGGRYGFFCMTSWACSDSRLCCWSPRSSMWLRAA